jgi:hypothetical protein
MFAKEYTVGSDPPELKRAGELFALPTHLPTHSTTVHSVRQTRPKAPGMVPEAQKTVACLKSMNQ